MPFLRRYTELPELLHILRTKKITLLDYQLWADKNDVYFMNKYKEKSNYKSVLALCFTETSEKYHHWKVYTKGSNGVCIVFNNLYLKDAFANDDNVICHPIIYQTIKDIKNHPVQVRDLPFVKRLPYQDEKEYRIIYSDSESEIKFKEYPIDILSCIEKIVLSPWLPEALFYSIKKVIKGIEGASSLPVHMTHLLEYARWKEVADNCR